jgi:MspA
MIRSATALTVAALVSIFAAPQAFADDAPDGAVESAPPATIVTPDGWQLIAGAANEVRVPVHPLTNTIFSREFDVSGTFAGTVAGKGSKPITGGVLEVGYQVGCNHTFGELDAGGSTSLFSATPSLGLGGALSLKIAPGQTVGVLVDKKTFKGTDARITATDVHIKVDGCIGGAYLRSYANLTVSTDSADDVVTYMGITSNT